MGRWQTAYRVCCPKIVTRGPSVSAANSALVPYESRLFVKTALVYLVLTFALGAVLLGMTAAGHPAPYVLGIEHGHLGFVGWLVNLVIGVALWMFPLDRERFPDLGGRYPKAAPLWSYCLLNAGLLMRVFLEPWFAGGTPPGRLWAVLLALSGVLQVAGIIIVGAILWYRTRGPRRPAPGVR